MTIKKMREYYRRGLWSAAMVDKLYAVGKISQAEYEYIKGE